MSDSDITVASSVDETLSWLEEYGPNGGVILAGGTDLFVEWSRGTPKAGHILYVGELEELKRIERQGNELAIGSLASMADIAQSSAVRGNARALSEAAGAMGSPLIRERATIGGNLCHASPAADTAAPLLALGASLELQSAAGLRQVSLEEFFRGPGETARRNDELLVSIRIPIDRSRHDFYLRLGQRRSLACVKVSVAGSANMGANRNSGVARNVRIALGAVAPIPKLARNAMAILEEESWTDVILEEAARAAMSECDPIDDIRSTAEYRRAMVGTLLKDGLEILRSKAHARSY